MAEIPKYQLTQTGAEVQAILDAVDDIKNAIWGTYVYNGSSTTSISFTDNNVSGRTFIIGSCQDAGSPISTINLNGTTITVNLYQAVTVARINYMAFS